MQAGAVAEIMADREAPTPARNSRGKKPPDFIAENLRRLFGAVESEELPDRFRRLLDRLAKEEAR